MGMGEPSSRDQPMAGANDGSPTSSQSWLMWYMVILNTLAFAGRAVPLPILSNVLMIDFNVAPSLVGVLIAIYPITTMIVSPLAAMVSVRTQRLVLLNGVAGVLMATSIGLLSLMLILRDLVGVTASLYAFAVFRAVQGAAFALFSVSNNALLVRSFPADVAYVFALIEVGIGLGSKFGRTIGGVFWDIGGYAFPFIFAMACVLGWVLLGFTFMSDFDMNTRSGPDAAEGSLEDGSSKLQPPAREAGHEVPWLSLMRPRTVLGMASAFVTMFQAGFVDTMLPPLLAITMDAPLKGIGWSGQESFLGLYFTAVCAGYVFTSFLTSQVFKYKLASFETIIAIGSLGAFLGCIIVPPQPFLEEMVFAAMAPAGVVVAQFLIGFLVTAAPLGPVFVSSLPLMQDEVKDMGPVAEEQVAGLFTVSFSLGEATGPILSGILVQQFGFPTALAATMPLFFSLFIAAIILRNPWRRGVGDVQCVMYAETPRRSPRWELTRSKTQPEDASFRPEDSRARSHDLQPPPWRCLPIQELLPTSVRQLLQPLWHSRND
mmetsp:Transcript_25297/g.58744  ORF Transcript_25297/g.58744 Transcript_25297/m.58744 type:complete len:545 (+) Transcript_25297:124-1758(+)